MSNVNEITNKISSEFKDSLSWRLFCLSVRGTENVHIYLWILKDLSWSLGYAYSGITFGLLALIWALCLFANTVKLKNTEEVYFLVPMFLWLFGNFWWMLNEFSGKDIYLAGRQQAGYIMLTAIIICQLFFIFFNFNWFTKYIENSEYNINTYAKSGYIPFTSYFKNWRQYEFFHMLCWIGKDISWNFLQKQMWFVFVTLTLVVSIDFIRVSAKGERRAVDFTHYLIQLIWLCANIVWSSGEVFELTSDDTHSIFTSDPITCRWLSAIILVCSYIPILLLYLVWIPLSYFGRIKEDYDIDVYEVQEDIL